MQYVTWLDMYSVSSKYGNHIAPIESVDATFTCTLKLLLLMCNYWHESGICIRTLCRLLGDTRFILEVHIGYTLLLNSILVTLASVRVWLHLALSV
jgi:hypothetical protein